MDENDKIQEILAMQDRQLQVDAIKMIEESNVPDKENTFKLLIKYFVAKKKKTYPIDQEKVKKEKRKYTESFRNAVEEEQKTKKSEKLIRQKKINQVLHAYGLEKDKLKGDKEKIRKFFEKCIKDEEERKSILMQIYEHILQLKEMIDQEPNQKKLETHRDFMERLKPTTIEKMEHTTTNKDRESKQEER